MDLLLLIAALVAVLDWVAVHTGRQRLEAVAKPLVPLMLIAWVASAHTELPATAVLTSAPPPEPVEGWVVLALALGLVGDVALLPQADRFVVGLGAFLIAHLAWIPALATRADVVPTVVAAGVLASGAVLAGRRILVGVRARGRTALAVAVVVYMVAVTTTAAVAVGTTIPVVAAGGLLFAVSDGLLGWDRFVARLAHGRTAVHVTYHLALGGLAAIAAT